MRIYRTPRDPSYDIKSANDGHVHITVPLVAYAFHRRSTCRAFMLRDIRSVTGGSWFSLKGEVSGGAWF